MVQATEGFVSLVPERARGRRLPDAHEFHVDGGDRTATLVEWINELVYHGEAEGWLPVDPTVEEVGPSGVRIECGALELREPFVLVKAATLHGAEIRERDGRLDVDVTLDI